MVTRQKTTTTKVQNSIGPTAVHVVVSPWPTAAEVSLLGVDYGWGESVAQICRLRHAVPVSAAIVSGQAAALVHRVGVLGWRRLVVVAHAVPKGRVVPVMMTPGVVVVSLVARVVVLVRRVSVGVAGVGLLLLAVAVHVVDGARAVAALLFLILIVIVVVKARVPRDEQDYGQQDRQTTSNTSDHEAPVIFVVADVRVLDLHSCEDNTGRTAQALEE
ncbi:hypothetical protein EGW08_015906, partial [Elysia chlorotica]